MSWIIIICIIYIAIIIRTYVAYNKDAKVYKKLDYYREELELSPSESAYLFNRNEEGIYLILADILSLVNKGIIKLETISKNNNEKEYILYKNSNIDFTKMKNHEALSYELFFEMNKGKEKVNLSEFLLAIKCNRKIYNDIEIKAYSIKYSIKLELEKLDILDRNARKKMQKINDKCIKGIVIGIIFVIISLILKNVAFSQFTYLTMFFMFILYNITDNNEDKVTQKGADILEKIKAQKKYIDDYILVEDKPIYAVNFLDYYYTMAVALGMADFGRKEFYKDTFKEAKRKRRWLYIKLKIKSMKEFYILNILTIIIFIADTYEVYAKSEMARVETSIYYFFICLLFILFLASEINNMNKF